MRTRLWATYPAMTVAIVAACGSDESGESPAPSGSDAPMGFGSDGMPIDPAGPDGVPVDASGNPLPDTTGPGVGPDGMPTSVVTPETPVVPGTDPTAVAPQDDTQGPVSASAAAEQCAALGAGAHAGVTKMRRLTQAQFNNTVRDLLAVTGEPASAFSLDEHIGPFQSNAIASITPLLVQQHDEVATRIAEEAVLRRADLSPCDLNQGDSCIAEFVQSFGTKAYRRPLTAQEQQEYVELFAVGQEQAGVEGGFGLVLQVLLQSPDFIYHVETGNTGVPTATATPLTSYELASRLSYFLWNTMPDDELFALAASDSLQDEATLSAQVTRMIADDKARYAVPYFHSQWLDLLSLRGLSKDQAMFPQFDTALSEAMLAEAERFTDYVVREGDGLMSTLFQADYGFPEGALFGVYGIEQPADFVPGTAVPLPAAQRRGVLTQAAFLSRHAHPNQTSPVHRGLLIRENLLCQPVQSPPPDVNNVPPEPTEATTTRERFAQHSADASCAACHQFMDPIGLAFENYDPIGAWRTQDGLSEVDASGEVLGGTGNLAGAFVGAVALSDKLADSQQIAECLANQWFRFALGRIEAPDDACTLQSVHEGFSASGRNIRELLTQIATSESFRHVRYQQVSQ